MKASPPFTSLLRGMAVAFLLISPLLTTTRADVIADWNTAFQRTLRVPNERGPAVPFRTLAIMHAAMFDAVNGITRDYEPLLMVPNAQPGARPEAAAIQAAYTTLSALRPTFQAAWDLQLAVSLETLPGSPGDSQSIARGRAWGLSVANAIIAWRATDGSTSPSPPFVGSMSAGYWRHAPLTNSGNAGFGFSKATPFLLAHPESFDPGPPYGFANRADALASTAYAADVNEIKSRGGLTSGLRTAAELDEALFLDACDIAGLNGVLLSKLKPNASLAENARAFALFNMAAFDSTVVFFRLKYQYAMWRPFQAIRYASEDANAATVADPTWSSYLPTPPHPDYVSGHVTLFTTLVRVIARLQGDNGPIELTSAASNAYPGGTKTYPSLVAISDACCEARVNIGFHFRETTEVSQILARHIADEIVDQHLQPRGNRGR